jgi:hypothetical protein
LNNTAKSKQSHQFTSGHNLKSLLRLHQIIYQFETPEVVFGNYVIIPKKYKNYLQKGHYCEISSRPAQNVCVSVWVRNFVSDTKRGTETEGVGEQGAEGIFGPKRDEVTGEWKKLHYEEIRNFHSSPNIITMITSRRMRWAGHVARMGSRGMHIGYWWESQKERDHQEDQGAVGYIILKFILER